MAFGRKENSVGIYGPPVRRIPDYRERDGAMGIRGSGTPGPRESAPAGRSYLESTRRKKEWKRAENPARGRKTLIGSAISPGALREAETAGGVQRREMDLALAAVVDLHRRLERCEQAMVCALISIVIALVCGIVSSLR